MSEQSLRVTDRQNGQTLSVVLTGQALIQSDITNGMARSRQ